MWKLSLLDQDKFESEGISGTIPAALSIAANSTAVIGRSEKADIILNAVVNSKLIVSRRHAELVASDKELTLRNLGALNGLFVNEISVQTIELHDGDIVQFGGASDVPEGKRIGVSDASIRYAVSLTARRTESGLKRSSTDAGLQPLPPPPPPPRQASNPPPPPQQQQQQQGGRKRARVALQSDSSESKQPNDDTETKPQAKAQGKPQEKAPEKAPAPPQTSPAPPQPAVVEEPRPQQPTSSTSSSDASSTAVAAHAASLHAIEEVRNEVRALSQSLNTFLASQQQSSLSQHNNNNSNINNTNSNNHNNQQRCLQCGGAAEIPVTLLRCSHTSCLRCLHVPWLRRLRLADPQTLGDDRRCGEDIGCPACDASLYLAAPPRSTSSSAVSQWSPAALRPPDSPDSPDSQTQTPLHPDSAQVWALLTGARTAEHPAELRLLGIWTQILRFCDHLKPVINNNNGSNHSMETREDLREARTSSLSYHHKQSSSSKHDHNNHDDGTPEEVSEVVSEEVFCEFCAEEGHAERDCPHRMIADHPDHPDSPDSDEDDEEDL